VDLNDEQTYKRLKLLIGGYILFIYASLPFMRDFVIFIYESIGKESLHIGINLLLIIFSILPIAFSLKKKSKPVKSLVWIAVPLLAVLIVIFSMERPEERVHFIEYGVLGLLVILTRPKVSGLQLGIAVGFVFAVGIIDELIQWVLPSRVGDLRDVIMNGVAGALGVWIGRTLFWD